MEIEYYSGSPKEHIFFSGSHYEASKYFTSKEENE